MERLLKHTSAAAAVALLYLACQYTQPGVSLYRAAAAALPSLPVFAAVAAIYALLDLLAFSCLALARPCWRRRCLARPFASP